MIAIAILQGRLQYGRCCNVRHAAVQRNQRGSEIAVSTVEMKRGRSGSRVRGCTS